MKKILLTIMAILLPIIILAGSGDVNGDGIVNIADIVELLNHLNGKATKNYQETEADANNDGSVDYNDVKSIADIILEGQYRYFRDETTGEEAVISSNGDVLLQKNSEDGGYFIEISSFDKDENQFSTEKTFVVELDEQEQVQSFVFSDFAIVFTPESNGQTNIALIKYNGDFEYVGQVNLKAKSRAIDSPGNPSLIGRLSTISDIWSAVGDPVKAYLSGSAINKTSWAGNLTGLFLGKSIEIPLERIGCDYSATVGNIFSLVVEGGINIGAGGAAFSNPFTAALFLLASYQEGRNHIFNKLIGKNFSVKISGVTRVSLNHYQANYTVSGMGESLITPEIDLVYNQTANNIVYRKTINHFCLNQDYVQEMENLPPGNNQFTIYVYIDGYRFLGSFKQIKYNFFVVYNELTDVEIKNYEDNNGVINQTLLVYSKYFNEVNPLSDYGIYIREGKKYQYFGHTQNVVESNVSGDGPSITANNQMKQELILEINVDDLVPVSEGSQKKKPSSDYYIGAYTYNNRKYEYYDEQPLELEYTLTTYCPDNNHPHWIDLGLPSGTLWRCCNEGASKPEEYGDYILPEMTSNAPSLDQILELLISCSYDWIKLNGVQGGKFTGDNGISIFLPAAGYAPFGEFEWIGEVGWYWSSTLEGQWNYPDLTFDDFSSGYHSCDYCYDLQDMKSVRPVRNK